MMSPAAIQTDKTVLSAVENKVCQNRCEGNADPTIKPNDTSSIQQLDQWVGPLLFASSRSSISIAMAETGTALVMAMVNFLFLA